MHQWKVLQGKTKNKSITAMTQCAVNGMYVTALRPEVKTIKGAVVETTVHR
jgi:hypothetical protein